MPPKSVLRVVVIAFVALVFFWCLQTFRREIVAIQFSRLWDLRKLVAMAAGLSLANYLLRAVRWRLYLQALGYRCSPAFALITYLAGFAFTLSPAKLGEMVRGGYYARDGLPLSRTAVAVVMERIMDLMVMLGLAFLTASTAGYSKLLVSAVLMILAVLACLATFPLDRMSLWLAQHPRLPARARRPFAAALNSLLGSRALLRPRLTGIAFLLGLAAWLCEGLGFALVTQLSPTLHLQTSLCVGIYALSIIVGALSFLPGGLGGTEAVMTTLLVGQGCSVADGILITLVCRLLTLWFAVLIGWLAVLVLRQRAPTAAADGALP